MGVADRVAGSCAIAVQGRNQGRHFWAAVASAVVSVMPDFRRTRQLQQVGTMPETEQLLPSTNGYYDIPENEDGSIDIWFGPKHPSAVADSAFIQTVPGRHFLVCVRLYGTGPELRRLSAARRRRRAARS